MKRQFMFLLTAAALLLWCGTSVAGDKEEKIEKLLDTVNSKEQAESRKAMQELGRTASGEPVVVHESMRIAESHPDWMVRALALQLLYNEKELDLSEFFKRVADGEKEVFPKLVAVDWLLKKGIERNAGVFLEGLKHENPSVQFAAVRGMYQAIPEGGKEKLLEIVTKRSPTYLVQHTVSALTHHGVKEADEPIIELIKRVNPDSYYYSTFISALSRLDTDKARAFVLECARKLGECKYGNRIITGLGRLKGSEEAFKMLTQLARYGDDVGYRMNALAGLSMTERPEALDILIEVMKSEWKEGYDCCLPKIYKFEGAKATRAILQSLNDNTSNRTIVSAIEELVRRKESKVIEACIKILKESQDSGYVHITAAAVEAIVSFKEKAAIPYVIDSLAITRNRAEHGAAFRQLRPFGKDVLIPVYTDYIKKPTKNVALKDSMCKELMELETPGLVDLFGKQLVGEIDPNMRICYARLLKKMAGDKAFPYLIQAFRKEEMCECFDALLDALGACKNPAAVQPVLDTKRVHLHDHWQVHADLALGEIGTKEAMEEVYKDFEQTKDPKIKAAAVAAIAASGDAEHVRNLFGLLLKKIDSQTRERIILGFVRIGDKTVEPHLLDLLKGERNNGYEELALDSLAELSGNASTYLRARLKDKNMKVVKTAIRLLLKKKDKKSLPEIRRFLDGEDDAMREYAASYMMIYGDAASAKRLRKFVESMPAGSRRYNLRKKLMKLEREAAKPPAPEKPANSEK